MESASLGRYRREAVWWRAGSPLPSHQTIRKHPAQWRGVPSTDSSFRLEEPHVVLEALDAVEVLAEQEILDAVEPKFDTSKAALDFVEPPVNGVELVGSVFDPALHHRRQFLEGDFFSHRFIVPRAMGDQQRGLAALPH